MNGQLTTTNILTSVDLREVLALTSAHALIMHSVHPVVNTRVDIVDMTEQQVASVISLSIVIGDMVTK